MAAPSPPPPAPRAPAGCRRCAWVSPDPLYQHYHDREWGVPEYDARALFEKLVLDGFQAGLSWLTILRKRDAFRQRFEGFVPERLARWGEAEIGAALADPGIVRHRGKIEASVRGARAWLALEADGPGFSSFVWDFVDGCPIQNNWPDIKAVPAQTDMSRSLSKALRGRGFGFCGPTIVYAFAQAVGMVNDHTVDCFRHGEIRRLGGATGRGRPGPP